MDGEKTTQRRYTGRVLVAEDNALNRRILMSMLQKEGVAADAVEDGAQMLEAVQRNDYALILSDVEMPVMGGHEAAARVRGLGGRKAAVPIVAVTSNVEQGARERCIAAGMTDYIVKPITVDVLRAQLQHYLEARNDQEQG